MEKHLSHNRIIFFFVFGIGAPLYFLGALFWVFQVSFALGALHSLLLVWRVYDSFSKTCARCPQYGSWRCGLPGKVVPYFFKKKHSLPSLKTIRLHYYIDVFSCLYALCWHALAGFDFALLALLWLVLAWFVAFGPKANHGLMAVYFREQKNQFIV